MPFTKNKCLHLCPINHTKAGGTMLRLNLTGIFKARGITRPYSFLIKAGFTHNVATRLAHNKSGSLQLNFIETLCLILNCEPNDLFYWEPDAKVAVGENHSLNKLRKTPDIDNMGSISQLSYKQMLKLSEKIEEIKKEEQ